MEVKEDWRDLAFDMVKKGGSIIREKWMMKKRILDRSHRDVKLADDREVEKELIRLVEESEYEFSILTEERGEIGDSDLRWIIDPIDGTVNYFYKIPFFNTTVALERKGDILLGATYDPMRDEVFYAEKGKGSFLNEEKIVVSDRSLSDSTIYVSGIFGGDHVDVFKELSEVSGIRKLGSGALGIAYVAAGRLDAFLTFESRIWDIAAGTILLEEAEGKVTDLEGDKFNFDSNKYLFSNGNVHEEILERISNP